MGNRNICIQKQRKIMQKETSFFGVCHVGAGEFVYPVKVNGKNIGFVSVGSFLLDTKEAKQKISPLRIQLTKTNCSDCKKSF